MIFVRNPLLNSIDNLPVGLAPRRHCREPNITIFNKEFLKICITQRCLTRYNSKFFFSPRLLSFQIWATLPKIEDGFQIWDTKVTVDYIFDN